MLRREALLGIALLAVWSRHTAGQATRLRRIALVYNDSPVADMTGSDPVHPEARAFVHAMRDLGYVEGRNIVIERRSAEGRPERLASLMQEIISSKVDVIVTGGRASLVAARATTSIPIVVSADDPVEVGLVASLSRPSRNLTGVATTGGPQINGKRLELLKEMLPSLSRVAVIDFKYVDSASTPGPHIRRSAIEASATSLSIDASFYGVNAPQDFEPAFAAIVAGRAQAILVEGSSVNKVNRTRIIDFADRQRLPAIAGEREFVAAGGLMSYGSNVIDINTQLAQYVDRILKGAKPSDLPYQQPLRYELVINLKTARRLGLDIRHFIMLRSPELIE